MRNKKVTSIKDKASEDDLKLARLIAEGCAKSEPSPECRAYVDGDLTNHPDKWREYGELAREAMDLALKDFWLGYYTKASVIIGAEKLKQELGIDEAPTSIRILIEHAVLCHVRLGMVEHLYSRMDSKRMDVVEHWERRLTLAQRRFTRAVTTLARTRALLARAEVAQAHAERATGRAGMQLVESA
ncbi:MAG TPA: hypothetical protein VEX70_13330 [Pyrinomonadaceae bacterium]|nr:hypothetical protein [Pyrinomonadaceae bacterium]